MISTIEYMETLDELGYAIDQEDGFETHEDAQQEADECLRRWGDWYGQDFWVMEYEQQKPKEERTYAHPNSVDGWEDIYPQED